MLEYLERRLRYLGLRLRRAHRFAPHAHSPFPVVAGRIDPPAGCGVIRFRSRLIGRAAEPAEPETAPGEPLPPKGREHALRQSADHLPVVLVDGVPAATGLGCGRIVVPAGRHLVQVQAMASGRYWPVEVPDGGTVRLSSVVAEPRYSGFLPQRMDRFYRCFALGPRAFVKPYQSLVAPTALAVALFAVVFLATGPASAAGPMAAVAVWGALAVWPTARSWWHRLRGVPVARYEPVPVDGAVSWRIVDPGDETPADAGGRAVLRIHPVFLHDAGGDFRPVVVERTRPPTVPVAAAPIPGRPERPDATVTEVLGEELEGIGRWTRSEWRALRRQMGWDADYRERLEQARAAESGRAAVLPWIDPPRVTIGDRELPAIWGLNEYRLEPGTYLVEVAVPGPPQRLDKGTKVDLPGKARLLYECKLEPGAVTTIEAYARITTVMGGDGLALREYSGRIWTTSKPLEQ
ncbi:hypothetical protein GCM10027447_03860 [Glycomyces halotolerans]